MEFVAITLESRCLSLVLLPDGPVELRAEDWPPGPDSVFERLDLSHGRVAFRVADGRYLARHVEHPGEPTDDGAAVHLVDELTQCAAFEELQLPGGYVSLRACDLRFLGVHTSGRVVADRVANGSWERFRYVEVPAPLRPAPWGRTPSVEPDTSSTVASRLASSLGGSAVRRSAHLAAFATA